MVPFDKVFCICRDQQHVTGSGSGSIRLRHGTARLSTLGSVCLDLNRFDPAQLRVGSPAAAAYSCHRKTVHAPKKQTTPRRTQWATGHRHRFRHQPVFIAVSFLPSRPHRGSPLSSSSGLRSSKPPPHFSSPAPPPLSPTRTLRIVKEPSRPSQRSKTHLELLGRSHLVRTAGGTASASQSSPKGSNVV